MSDESIDQPTRNREAWLTDFTAMLLPLVKQRTGLTIAEGASYKLSCGFPSKGGTRSKNRTIGECHHVGTGGERKFHQIFVHPQLVDPVEIGGVIAHEILHAMLPSGVGHRKPFSRAASALGLEGKPTATHPGEELSARIKDITELLGAYPHESLNQFGGPKQTTRLLKCMCPLCGYVVRVTYKWLDEAGAPICPQCLISMEEAGSDAEASLPLYAVDQTVEYKVRKIRTSALEKVGFDPRWSIRMNRRADKMDWFVMDYGPAIDPETGHAVLGIPNVRLTRAESRQDAIALLESLRDGTMTYDDIDVNDDDPELDVTDPFYEDEDETSDEEPFTEEELEVYEEELRDREQGRPKVQVTPESSYEERIAELERLRETQHN